ncbi:MAG: signal peptide peptidase SppA [Caulobacterales bacterium]
MKQFLITVAGVLVGLILFLVIAPMVLFSSLASHARDTQKPTGDLVLALDLRSSGGDQPSQAPFAGFGGSSLSTIEIVRKLSAAGADKAVKGVLIRANTAGMAPAQSEEVRNAIADLRKAGKFVFAHVQNDTLETSLSGYGAIAGADEIWLHETGGMMPMGIASEGLFLGGFFQKYKMQPQFEQREEYKNAVNQYTERGYTKAHREATEAMIGSIYDTFIANIAADRKLTPEAVKAAIEGTPYTGKKTVELKLADKLGRPEDAEAAALQKAGKGAEMLDLADYKSAKKDGPVIALIGGEGGIVTGPGDSSPFADEALMNSDDIAAAFKSAVEDDEVKAIVFRVSSPGGSPVASDQILHAVEQAKAKGKPVVVSMGEYAASGGYYVSAAADAIVALPTTLTGSIGIFGGKVVIRDALDSYLAIEPDEIKVGSPYANMFTSARPFTNAERATFAAMIDEGYVDFKGKVAAGRKLPIEKVNEIAKGRVWTGAQAKANGLVDELGGLNVAIARAKALANLKADQVQLRLYPERKSPLEEVQELFGVSGEAARAAVVLGKVMGDERVSQALNAAMRQNAAIRAESESVRVR